MSDEDLQKEAEKAARARSRTPQKPAVDSRWHTFYEGAKPWLPYFAIGAFLLAIYVGAHVEATENLTTELLAFLMPIASLAYVVLPVRDVQGSTRTALFGLTLATLAVSVGLVYCTIHPPGLLSDKTVTATIQSYEFTPPAGVTDFVVYSRNMLIPEAAASDGTYGYSLERGGVKKWVRAKVSRVVGRKQRMMRSAAPSQTVTQHEEEIHHISLPGSGPVTVSYVYADKSVRRAISFKIYSKSIFTTIAPWLLLLLFLASIYVESLVGARHVPAPIAGGVAAAAVFAAYLVDHFEPIDGYSTVLGAIFVAIVGSGAGFAIGHFASKKLVPMLVIRKSKA